MKFFLMFLVFIPALMLSGCFEQKPEEIKITDVYAFATAPGAKTGAAFMVIENNLKEDDRLIDAQSDIAEITEIHENYIDPDDGMMMMRKIRGIDIAMGDQAILEPKGLHIMLIKLKQPLTLGEVFDLRLVFEKSGMKTVQVKIVKPGAGVHVH